MVFSGGEVIKECIASAVTTLTGSTHEMYKNGLINATGVRLLVIAL